MWKQQRETDCKSDGSRGDLEGQNIIRTLKMKGKGGRERGEERGERREERGGICSVPEKEDENPACFSP